MVVHNLIKDIGDAAEPKWCKIWYFGGNGKFCTNTETLFPHGQQRPQKFFFPEWMSESLERALLVEYACQIKSLSHMVR